MKRIISIPLIVLATQVHADNLTFKFDNPSFNGNGYSSHVLSIEQLQFTRKKDIQDEQESKLREAKREEENKTINKFINNVESRIYAQLSKQMVDNMFTNTGDTTGTAQLDGATIYWVKDASTGTITIQITE